MALDCTGVPNKVGGECMYRGACLKRALMESVNDSSYDESDTVWKMGLVT